MKIAIHFLLLLLMTSNLYSDANPLPSDIKAHEQMAKEFKAQIKQESAQSKKMSEERAMVSNQIPEQEEIEDTLKVEEQPKQKLEVKSFEKASNQESKYVENAEVALPENEEDRYEHPNELFN